MNDIEGEVIGVGGNARRTWINIRTPDGTQYRGTCPGWFRPSDIIGHRIRLTATTIRPTGTGTFEYTNPHNAEYLDEGPR
jgi:hypothetical protein